MSFKGKLNRMPTTTLSPLGWKLAGMVANTDTGQPTLSRWTDSYFLDLFYVLNVLWSNLAARGVCTVEV